MSQHWRTPTAWDDVCRRSSGRRWYNSVRRTQAQIRRIAIMRTVTALPPPYGIWHLPYGMRTQLAQQWAVSTWTISSDVKRLNTEDLQHVDRWVAEARERKERIMGARMTIRLPAALRARLEEVGAENRVEVSEVVRQALRAYLDTERKPHSADDCMRTLLQECEPKIIALLGQTATQLSEPLVSVVKSMLYSALKPNDRPSMPTRAAGH